MGEIQLIYKGKKKPFQFDNPKTGKLSFTPGLPVWIPAASADWLMGINPGMFTKTGERGLSGDEVVDIDDAAEVIKKKAEIDEAEVLEDKTEEPEIVEPESYTCPKCNRLYKDKQWFDRHVIKCEE